MFTKAMEDWKQKWTHENEKNGTNEPINLVSILGITNLQVHSAQYGLTFFHRAKDTNAT